MTFVRLAGCNAADHGLDCIRWCDTPESWDPSAGEDLDLDEVCRRITLPRVCLTGGEPLLQLDGVAELALTAGARGLRTHLETNGTIDGPCAFDWVTVSPKPPEYMIRSSWRGRVDELKIVVGADLEAATAERVAASHPEAVVCLQPEYGKKPEGPRAGDALERAVSLVMAHPGWRLSLQMHKHIGLR